MADSFITTKSTMGEGEEEKREMMRDEEVLSSPGAMVVEEEEEDEEERIEKFFQLVRSIREMKKEIRRSISFKRERTVLLQHAVDQPWKPRFIMEDFNVGRSEKKRMEDDGKRRKLEKRKESGEEEEEVTTDLELRLGL